MTYSTNSSEINTRLYDFRVKKRKISTATKSDSNGKQNFAEETRDENKNSCVHFFITF